MDQSEIHRFEGQTKTLRLSEAIRIGARMRPQCQGDYFAQGGSCALGAAMEAVTGVAERTERGLEYLLQFAPGDIWDEVIYMNEHGNSREQIADWLETQGY